jgi:hypothetical protein
MAVDDGTGSDVAANDGVVTFNGSLGPGSAWGINVSTGVSKPVTGTSKMPNMDLNSINVSTLGTGNLTIELSDDNFVGTIPASAPGFKFDLGGTTTLGNSVAAAAYADSSNTLFAQTENIGALGPFTGGAFSGTSRSPTAQTTGTPYSLTIVVKIFHGVPGAISSFDAQLQAVPEPASIATWSILAMVGVGGLVRSRRQRS